MASYAAAYARALADVVTAPKDGGAKLDVASVDGQLQDFADSLRASHELKEVLSSPSFKLERRLAILDSLNQRMQMSREVRNFVAVLIRNGRLHAFHEIFAAFRREMNQRSGIADALVTSARRLDDTERQAMETRAAALAGVRVRAAFEQDSSLIGGVVLRIGSTVYDGSVRGRLARMKEQLIAG